LDFPIEGLAAGRARGVAVVADFRCLLRDNVVLKEWHFTPAVPIGADRRLDPERVDHIGFNAVCNVGLVKVKESFFEGSSIVPRDRSLGEALEGSL
jgi:hypothetical protein